MSLLATGVDILYYNGAGPLVAYVGLTLLAVAVYLRNPYFFLNKLFAVLSLIAALWNLAAYQIFSATTEQEALAYWKIYHLIVLLLVPTLAYFCGRFAGRHFPSVLIYSPPLMFIPFIAFTNLVTSGVIQSQGHYVAVEGPLLVYMNLMIVSYIVLATYRLYSVYVNAAEETKRRAFLMWTGIGIVVLMGIIDITLDFVGIRTLPLSPPTALFAVFQIGRSLFEGES